MENLIAKAKILMEALPYIRRYSGKTVVIKYGGNAMVSSKLQHLFASDIALLHYVGLRPIIVHGGGPQISAEMKLRGKKSHFVQGLRFTGDEEIEVVKMVLAGKINKEIVALISNHGRAAVGLSGGDGNLIKARRYTPLDEQGAPVDIGWVGEVASIDPTVIEQLVNADFVPVVASLGVDDEGHTYNINADTAAAQLAVALKADKLIFLTDVEGIYSDPKNKDSLISVLKTQESQKLLNSGRVGEGMLPKLKACIDSVEGGVSRAHILNGTIEHALLLEIFTDKGIGTMVTI